ncbi:hypothetical protein EPN15_02200 [Patescibacteria group bacterium]|nr:MAG: hypothetical protein EPN15_02200 [Patescibacteria group bacterium]
MIALSLIPLTFLLAFGAIILFGKKLKHNGATLALSIAGFAFLLSSIHLIAFQDAEVISFEWFRTGNLTIEFSMMVDRLTVIMITLVAFITTLVFIYSRGYMKHDGNKSRFWAEMCLFAGSMTGIVLAGNVPTLMVFWGLVGVSSYLLIGFWHQKKEAAEAARKAFTIISLGDAMLLAGLLTLFGHFHTFDFQTMIENSWQGVPALSMLLIFGGIAAKSAQFPLFVWLGWAMEGPTPVSALLHSATMVKAGVFIGLKLFPLFLASGILPFIFAIGLITVFISSILAIFERDIKKILAWSTVGQLGFMTVAFGLGSVLAAFFQLVMHAFFKALLFLDAGNAMHLNEEKRDLYSYNPVNFRKARIVLFTSLIGILGLAGVPPTNGFWSKDLILETVRENSGIFFAIMLVAVFLSAMYSFRWFFLLARRPQALALYNNIKGAIQKFPSNYSSVLRSTNQRVNFQDEEIAIHRDHQPLEHHQIFELSFNMLFSPIILSVLVLSAGIFLPIFNNWFSDEEVHFDLGLMSLSVVIVGFAAVICYFIYYRESNGWLKALPWLGPDYRPKFLNTSMGIESMYAAVGNGAISVGRFLYKIDRQVLDALIDDTARLGLQISQFALKFDIMGIDKLVNRVGAAGIAAGNMHGIFDQRIIDRMVKVLADGTLALGWKTRQMVNGIIDTYLAYVVVGVLALLIIAEFLFSTTR